jgi:hypothetical protein
MAARRPAASLNEQAQSEAEVCVMATAKTGSAPRTETIEIKGANVPERVRQLIHEGNVRRITITHKGDIVLSIPVTVGLIGTLLAPWLAAIGAAAALLSDCTIEVERRASGEPPEADESR